jgi:hypothetical protein
MNHIAPVAESAYGERPVLAWIDKHKLIIDARYQRSIEGRRSQRTIAQIRANFSWKKCGPLHVTNNGDDTWCVIDGQHRLAAVMPLPDITEMPCWDLGEMSLQEQAVAFVDINTSRVAVTPIQIHIAKAKAGDPVCRQMDEVAAAAGCRIRQTGVTIDQQKQGDMTCLATLRKSIAANGPDLTTRALRCVRDAWDDAGGIRGEIFQAAIDVLKGGGTVEDLMERLRRRRPEQVLAMAHGRRALDPLRPLSAHVLAVILENRGRK